MTKYFKVLGSGFKTRNDFEWLKALSGEWIEEKDCEKSLNPRGKGLHVWKNYPRYTVHSYIEDHTFEAECDGLLGEDDEKARFRKIRLVRLVPRSEIFCKDANLSNADLRYANLSNALNLTEEQKKEAIL